MPATTEVIAQSLTVGAGSSKRFADAGIIVTVRTCSHTAARVVIGTPGSPNLVRDFELGDAVLFETPTNGLFEVRAMALGTASIEVLVTKVSPRVGFIAGLDSDGGQNARFAADEVEQIKRGLEEVAAQIKTRGDVADEQFELLRRKLDELTAASTRLGRKDWIMYSVGTMTNILAGAAFPPEAVKAVLSSMDQSLGWVFQNALRLLSK